MAAGDVNAASTDAVNGSQLYAIDQKISQNTADISDINNSIANINNGSVGLVQQDATSRKITVAKDTDGTTVDISGTEGDRSVTGVKRGVADNDAVNVSQLKGATSALGGGSTIDAAGNVTAPTYNVAGSSYSNVGDALHGLDSKLDDNFNKLNSSINKVNQQANRGIAASAALVNNMPYIPGRVTVNAGVASYRGEAALAMGVSRWSDNGRVNINAGVSAARGDVPIFRVGVGLVLGD